MSVKEVTRYQTADGKLWKAPEEAARQDRLLKDIEKLKSLIPGANDDSTSFANGDGYYQLRHQDVQRLKTGFRTLLALHMGAETVRHFDQSPTGIVGRILSDSDTPLYGAWLLLYRLDSQNRLWGQPYFASHPHEGEQRRLNP